MKLWDKGYSIDTAIERFTIGKDKELDLLLAPYEVHGVQVEASLSLTWKATLHARAL